MRNKILASVLAAVLLAIGLGFVPGSLADATIEQTPQPGAVCYDKIPQSSWTRSIPQFKTQHEVDKFVRERTRTDRQHYSWTGGKRDVDDPPTVVPPHRDWQTNTRQEPHSTGGGNPATWVNESLHYTANSKGHASWFYFVGYGDWTEWSTPTRWLPTGSHLAWVAEVPTPVWGEHSYSATYQRDWAVLPTGATRQVEIAPKVENVGPIDGTNPPEGDGWTQVGEVTYRDGESFPCPTASATPGTCEAQGILTTNPGDRYTESINDDDPANVTVTFTAKDPLTVPQTIERGTFDISQTPETDPACQTPTPAVGDGNVTLSCEGITATYEVNDITPTQKPGDPAEVTFEVKVNGEVAKTETLSFGESGNFTVDDMSAFEDTDVTAELFANGEVLDTATELIDCHTPEIPDPEVTYDLDLSCDDEQMVGTQTTVTSTPVWNPELGEYEFETNSVTVDFSRPATAEELAECEDDTPPTTTPPTTTPPTTTPPTTTPPVPPTNPPTDVCPNITGDQTTMGDLVKDADGNCVAKPPTSLTSLPRTGVTTALVVAVGLVLLGLGAAAVTAGRRAKQI